MTISNTKKTRHNDKKHEAVKMSDELFKLGDEFQERAERMSQCAETLWMEYCEECGHTYFKHVNYCKDRLCPLCNWLKGKFIFYQLRDTLNSRQNEYKYFHLILTVRNCENKDLNVTINLMSEAWKKLQSRSKFKKSVSGWFKTTELKIEDDGMIHPHIHVLLEVPYDCYGKYVTEEEFAEMWDRSLKSNYSPYVILKSVNYNDTDSIARLANYISRGEPIEKLTNDKLSEYANAVSGKRLYSSSGTLKIATSRKKKSKESDSKHNHDGICPDCEVPLGLVRKDWNEQKLGYDESIIYKGSRKDWEENK